MEDKIVNTVEEVMENNDAMTEVCKTGKNGGLIATIVTGGVLVIGTAAALIGRALKKRKAEKNHVAVEISTEETVANEETEG